MCQGQRSLATGPGAAPREHTVCRGGESREKDIASQPRGETGGAGDAGKDARLRPGVGDGRAWAFPEEVTSVGREAQTSAADGHILVSSPNHHRPHPTAEEQKLQDSEGPTSQIQLAAELGLLISLWKK